MGNIVRITGGVLANSYTHWVESCPSPINAVNMLTMLNPYTLLLAQIVAHLGLVYFLFSASLQHWLVCLIVYFFSGCMGMTMTYHRYVSHQSWKAPQWFEILGVLSATIGLTGSAISWSAIHRKHHRHSDTKKDPHSPKHKGFIYCQWFSMFEPIELRYVTDLLRNPVYKYQHQYYLYVNIIYALILFILDPYAIIYAWLAPAAILWNAGSSIVSLGHIWGFKPQGSTNEARNNPLLGFLVWGEGWHHNHHENPQSPIFCAKYPLTDLGGALIRLIEKRT